MSIGLEVNWKLIDLIVEIIDIFVIFGLFDSYVELSFFKTNKSSRKVFKFKSIMFIFCRLLEINIVKSIHFFKYCGKEN